MPTVYKRHRSVWLDVIIWADPNPDMWVKCNLAAKPYQPKFLTPFRKSLASLVYIYQFEPLGETLNS